MNTKCLFIPFVLLISLLVSGCAASTPANPADRFAGTWSGTMSFTDVASRNEDVIITVPTGCTVGSVCGDSYNVTINCSWEITLEAVNGDVFEYTFSKTLGGECPALTSGTLTLQPDGKIWREHKTPSFTARGVLTRK
jgi:hypothetical protein